MRGTHGQLAVLPVPGADRLVREMEWASNEPREDRDWERSMTAAPGGGHAGPTALIRSPRTRITAFFHRWPPRAVDERSGADRRERLGLGDGNGKWQTGTSGDGGSARRVSCRLGELLLTFQKKTARPGARRGQRLREFRADVNARPGS